MTALQIERLRVERDGAPVLEGVDLQVEPGTVTVLLGANGAGKTTLLEAVSGVLPIAAGSVRLGDAALNRVSKAGRARMGLAHVEQGRSIFATMTVDENLRVGCRHDAAPAEAYALFPELAERRALSAAMLSGGEQQMLVIARALLGRPRVLMVDEMSQGLAPIVVRRLLPVLAALARQGLAVLLVEQFAALALSIGERAYVLGQGRIAYAGRCEHLLRHPETLQAAYLGHGADRAPVVAAGRAVHGASR